MPKAIRVSALALAVAALGACQANEPAPAASAPPPSAAAPSPAASSPVFSTLSGTSWRLAEFQSMDDSQGTRRPADPASYTVSFGADGRAAFRLDCNRGSATWTNALANATGGSLEFGPLAMTRAMCPPGSMSDFLAAQMPYVRSFTIRDGRLAMSLMADGGIIVWEPIG